MHVSSKVSRLLRRNWQKNVSEDKTCWERCPLWDPEDNCITQLKLGSPNECEEGGLASKCTQTQSRSTIKQLAPTSASISANSDRVCSDLLLAGRNAALISCLLAGKLLLSPIGWQESCSDLLLAGMKVALISRWLERKAALISFWLVRKLLWLLLASGKAVLTPMGWKESCSDLLLAGGKAALISCWLAGKLL